MNFVWQINEKNKKKFNFKRNAGNSKRAKVPSSPKGKLGLIHSQNVNTHTHTHLLPPNSLCSQGDEISNDEIKWGDNFLT